MPAPRYPFPAFPAGWFEVAQAQELRPGQALGRRVFGQELALFRTDDGVAHALDAHCPHLGAHLGHGGQVRGDTLVCPFHRWAFDGAGQCTEIPYSDKAVPRAARVRCWPLVERNGALFVWHHPAQAAPDFDLPHVPEAGHPDWSPQWSISRTVRFHCQEIRENGVDAYHFQTVHGMPPADLRVQTEGPVLVQQSRVDAPTSGAERMAGTLRVEFHGLGYAVARHRLPGVETLVLSSITPIDEHHCRMRFALSMRHIRQVRPLLDLARFLRQAEGDINDHGVPAKASLRRVLASAPRAQVLTGLKRAARSGDPRELMSELLTQLVVVPSAAELARQLDQDIYITERKAYLQRPIYRDGERPIHQLRTWARQFYPDTTGARAAS